MGATRQRGDRTRYTLEEKQHIIGEVEFIGTSMWPPKLAADLGFTSVDHAREALKRWGRADLAATFEVTLFDGNSDPRLRTIVENQRERRARRAQEQEAA